MSPLSMAPTGTPVAPDTGSGACPYPAGKRKRDAPAAGTLEWPVSQLHLSFLRSCAGRWSVGAPSVAVVDESSDDEHRGSELQGGVAMPILAVGAAA